MLGSDEMNNYNYEYMSYSNGIPNGDANMPDNSDIFYQGGMINEDRINYMPNMDNYKIQFLNQSNPMNQMMPNKMPSYGNSSLGGKTVSGNANILDVYPGFIRGNMFANLYDGYKNFKPQEINSKSERENLLNQWQQYNFALIDLDLYLDTHPNESNVVKLYNNYLKIEKQIRDKYESMYGPLTLYSDDLDKNSWVWIRSPWPWEEI